MRDECVSIEIEKFITGPLETNTYVVSDARSTALIIDPSSQADAVIDFCTHHSLLPGAIVLTHAHFDHCLGINQVREQFPGLDVYVHPEERPLLVDAELNGSYLIGTPFRFTEKTVALNEGAMCIGDFDFSVLHVPGHSPGGCALCFDMNCICGDAIFAGSIGRTDFPGGSYSLLLDSIREKIFTLPDQTVLWPGHGGRTTVGREKRMNPFFTA
jgi:glyoxylase-like metal-dependent hydrolase (beta-lactamase superfamily II)